MRQDGRKEGGLNCQKIVVGNGDQGGTKLRDCNDIAKIVSFLMSVDLTVLKRELAQIHQFLDFRDHTGLHSFSFPFANG